MGPERGVALEGAFNVAFCDLRKPHLEAVFNARDGILEISNDGKVVGRAEDTTQAGHLLAKVLST